MNYSRAYNSIVVHYRKISSRAEAKKKFGYVESHHIIPRCMGGLDEESNIVHLPAKAHFIAHYLLVKMYPDSKPLWSAFSLMSGQSSKRHQRNFRVSAQVYDLCKRELSRVTTGSKRKPHTEETKKKIGLANAIANKGNKNATGKIKTEATKEKIRQTLIGRKNSPCSDRRKEKIRAAKLGNTHSAESRLKMSLTRKGKPLSEETKLKKKISMELNRELKMKGVSL